MSYRRSSIKNHIKSNYDIEDNCSYQQNLPIIHELCRFFGCATIAFGDIGCGLAGGDWRIVRNHILEPIFGTRTKVSLYIHWLDEENYMKAQELMQQPNFEDPVKEVCSNLFMHEIL